MACFSPIKAFAAFERNPDTGKRPFVFDPRKALIESDLRTLPCGGCIGCRIAKAEGWAIRSTHESVMHEFHLPGTPGSSFLTLTFRDGCLPSDNSVSKATIQDFVRRLRRLLGSTRAGGPKLRYLACGEYGSKRKRAHYHLLLFGHSFPDRVLYKVTEVGHRLYESEVLSKAWPFGLAIIGDVSYETARYVGGYVTKKIGGERAESHYTRVSPVDGATYRVEPEFALMSLKPGLGQTFFERFKSDIFPSDQVIMDGRIRKPPRFYEKLLSETELLELKRVRRRRTFELKAAHGEDWSKDRLKVREVCANIRAHKRDREVD